MHTLIKGYDSIQSYGLAKDDLITNLDRPDLDNARYTCDSLRTQCILVHTQLSAKLRMYSIVE